MKIKNDINISTNKTPFIVPENYFEELKDEIHRKCTQENHSLFTKNYFLSKKIIPSLATISILIFLFWTNLSIKNPSYESSFQEELYVYLLEFEFENMDNEYLYEMITESEYPNNLEIEYLINIDTDYDLIINEL